MVPNCNNQHQCPYGHSGAVSPVMMWVKILGDASLPRVSAVRAHLSIYIHSDESSVSVARVPQSDAPKSPNNPSFLAPKDSKEKKTALEEKRKNVRSSSAPRPRAVLSSPDNDGIIGTKTQTRAKPVSGLKTRSLDQNRHTQCKVFPKSSGAESFAPAKGYDHKESTEPKNNARPRHHRKIGPSSVQS